MGFFVLPTDGFPNSTKPTNQLKLKLNHFIQGYQHINGQILVGSESDLTILEQDGSTDLIVAKGLLLTTTQLKYSPTRLSGKGLVAIEMNGLSTLDLKDSKLKIKKSHLVAWDTTVKVESIDEFETRDYSRKFDIKPLFQRIANHVLNFVGNWSRYLVWLTRMKILNMGKVELLGPGRIFISK